MPGFQPAITLSEAIGRIKRNEYLLPAFQREYVWKPEQIERLFDSLMRGYPISSMLFWKLKGEVKNKWKFYEFLDFYREEFHIHNKKFENIGNDCYAILDGQQRLTSIYLALCSHYDIRKKYAKKLDNDKNFQICDFYFNLTADKNQPTKHADIEYEFLWKDREETKEEIIYTDKHNQKWFKCNHLLKIDDIDDFIDENNFSKEEKKKFRVFNTLINNTNDKSKINYYLIEDENPDIATDIFIRINSGATRLEYSDILFSYAVSNWKKKDARTEITGLVDYINQTLEFNINKDLILKIFLFLY